MTHELETVQIIGVRPDGVEVDLGAAPMPPRMKAKDIVRSYFGEIDEESGNDGAMALWCCNELIDWMSAQTNAQKKEPA